MFLIVSVLESSLNHGDAVKERGINSIDPKEHVARLNASWVRVFWVQVHLGWTKGGLCELDAPLDRS